MMKSHPAGRAAVAVPPTLFLPVLALTLCFGWGPSSFSADAPPAPKAGVPDAKPAPTPASAKGKPKNEAAAEKADEKKAEEPEKPAEPPIHTVKRGEFELKVELDGVFVSAKETPIAVAPEAWADLTVVEAVPHGAMVKEGDVLVRFDTEKLTEEIADLKKGAPLAELNLEIASRELATLEKTTPLALNDARRAKMHSEEDLAYYEDVSKAMRIRDAEEDVKRMEQALAYATEELKQLEKMYEADDLTEETEEIILQRARNDVERTQWMLEQTRENTKRTLGTGIPREHDARRLDVERQGIAWREAEAGLPDALTKKRLEVQAQERALVKSRDRLADLESDLATLTVRAPHDGVVYYGASSRGKWITAATVDRKLVPGGKLLPHEVFLTLVRPAPLQIQVAVPEGKLRHLAPGLKGHAWPAWDADAEFATELKTVSFVPYADNTYDAVFSTPAKPVGDGAALYPGMSAKVRLDLYEAANALTVPKKGVHKDAGGHYVHLKDGTKRKVKVGKSNDQSYEILEGLKEGDEVKIP